MEKGLGFAEDLTEGFGNPPFSRRSVVAIVCLAVLEEFGEIAAASLLLQRKKVSPVSKFPQIISAICVRVRSLNSIAYRSRSPISANSVSGDDGSAVASNASTVGLESLIPSNMSETLRTW